MADNTDFDSLVEAAFKAAEPTEAEVTAAPTEGSTPEEKPAEAVPQEAKTTETPTESPSEPAPQPSPVVDADAIAESLIETDEARNLVAKYKAAGKTTAEAVREALKHSAPAYWDKSKAEAEKARAAKEQVESPSAPIPSPEPTVDVPAELQSIDQRMQALVEEHTALAETEQTISGQLANINAEIDQRIDQLSQELDFETEKSVKARLAQLKTWKREHEGYLKVTLPREKSRIERDYRQEEIAKFNTERVLELSRAREAEARERQRLADDYAKTAEESRRRGIFDAWNANLEVVAKEGDPVPDDLMAKFTDAAMMHLARKDPKTGAEVGPILREFKREWDELGDKLHRLKSKTYAEKKDQHVAVNAPVAPSVQPVVKKRGAFTDDEWDQVVDSRFGNRATA